MTKPIKTRTRYWVEFYYTGLLFSETEIHERRKPRAAIKLPERAYGYRTYQTREEIRNGTRLCSGRLKESPMHFRGRVLTLADVKREYPSEAILISNMEINGCGKVVMVNGATYPVGKNWVQIQ